LEKKGKLPERGVEYVTVPIYKKGDKTDCSKLLSRNITSTLSCHGTFQTQGKLSGSMCDNFGVVDQLLMRNTAFVKYRRKTLKCSGTVHQPFIDFKKTNDTVRKDVLQDIPIEFDIQMKLVRLIELSL
jgi:hypothetical protein